MKDRMEKLVLLPFSVGCISESSVAIGQHHKRSSPEANLTPTRSQEEGKEEEQEQDQDDDKILEGKTLKSPLSIALPRFQRLFKNFKNLSQLFVDKDEMEQETGMEIGLPTDVKHVTHIGVDGDATSILSRSW